MRKRHHPFPKSLRLISDKVDACYNREIREVTAPPVPTESIHLILDKVDDHYNRGIDYQHGLSGGFVSDSADIC